MAKGNRGGRGRQVIATHKDGMTIGSEKIEFDGDLRQTVNDSSITVAQRKVLDVWEKKREKQKIEYGNAVGYNGSEYGERRGGKNGVNLPLYYNQNPGSVLTHIHPREDGGLGGTFSPEDIGFWASGKGHGARAVAKEGTYSISKGKNFNAKAMYQWFSNNSTKRMNEYTVARGKLKRALNNGKMTYKQYQAAKTKAFNTTLVNLHNDLLNNQSVYGYNYYLEKR